MALRRRLGALADMLLRSHLVNEQAQNEDKLIRGRQAALSQQNYVQSILGRILADPAMAARLKGMGMTNVAGLPIDAAIPTADEATAGLSGQIAKANTPQEVPTDADILGGYAATVGANRGPDNPQIARLIQQANARRNQQMSLLPPQSIAGVYDPTTGATSTKLIPGAEALRGGTFQTGPTPEQAGRDFVTTANLERPAKAADARATSAGAAAGSAPYNPEWLYDNAGNATPFVQGPGGPKAQPMPPGYSKNDPTASQNGNLPVSLIDQVSGINTAEREGVKILSMLKQTGLDQSNDPLDPRWNLFLAGTLKMSGDQLKGDAQQRTAFVKAAILRSLMGGRPSQYIAKIYEQHIPSGDMTGSKLWQVLNNVLQQGSERREEIGNVSGRTMNGPLGGGYAGWLATGGVGSQPDASQPAPSPAKSKLNELRKR